jgi:hypothetical protein
MVSGVWLALVRFGVREAIWALVIAQAVSYIPLIFGLRRLLPETAKTEILWYVGLIAMMASATLVPWPGN